MHVEVCEYNPAWPEQFRLIKENLEHILRDTPYIRIEHVGSTSVPGLCAKPVIDIDIIITQEQLQAVVAAFEKDGSYFYEGDRGIPERYSVKHTDETICPKRNVYICIDGCQALRNHLAVRDLCRQDAKARERYAQKKRGLSTREWKDVDEYATAKTEVLNWVLNRAGFATKELKEIAVVNGVTE